MAEDLVITQGDKEAQYQSLLPQIEALIGGETDLIANLANISAALKEQFGFLWVGFYLIKNNELVLGPFQGPVACTRIAYNRGVCGTAWAQEKTLIVPNVDEFPGHIACSSRSKSEIVIPFYLGGKLTGVLDIDSESLNNFCEIDEKYLKKLLNLLS
ncbi:MULTISPECIES: GAF domain-containing protein [Sphingobacterium]|uniref:GAF domain-containing protein n=1 Tax=Sphingobacterium thermophilum TaxID=768534 RepID=A0ABP8R1M0_9SPHI|nr:GAF domain-containing protein [Sphingobacterium sp. T2]